MLKNTTTRLLDKLNAARGRSYPDIGYEYLADIKGDGQHCPRVYSIINAHGGVTLSPLNAGNARQRCAKIRDAIAQTKG